MQQGFHDHSQHSKDFRNNTKRRFTSLTVLLIKQYNDLVVPVCSGFIVVNILSPF